MDRLTALFLTNSEHVAARYRPAFGRHKVEVVDQAVAPDRRDDGTPLPPSAGFRCVSVGSISPYKRQEEAIEALSRLSGEGRAAELLIIGEGNPVYGRKLRDLATRLGVESSVFFLGEVPTAWPFIESADVVVNCSRNEAEAFSFIFLQGTIFAAPPGQAPGRPSKAFWKNSRGVKVSRQVSAAFTTRAAALRPRRLRRARASGPPSARPCPPASCVTRSSPACAAASAS